MLAGVGIHNIPSILRKGFRTFINFWIGLSAVVRDFRVGDLVKMKPASEVFQALPASAGLVLVTNELPTSPRFFYGRVCATGEEHLWSYDQFFLLSRAGEKNF